MKQHQFSFVQALIVAVGVLFFSGCNGEKIDSDLIDSITGKVSVDKITIDQEDFEITEGESTVLTATVLPADATDKTVSWNSSKEDVVMISNTGKAMAIAPGKSIITAKAGSKTDFITITVIANAVPVTGISLDKTTLELKVGDSETLTATVTPPDATNKNVSWTSSDPTIATVENGRVTGVKPGSVTITAKTEDGGKIAECAVTVKTNLAPSVTVGAVNISAVSVVMKGEANLDVQMSSDMTMGIMWSENSGVLPSNSTKIEAKNIEAKEGSTTSYCYSVNLTGLDTEKNYYFRSYVTQNSQDTYGETMSFTTRELSSLLKTLDASEIETTSAILNGIVDLSDVSFASENIEYGFYWGELEDSQNTYLAGGEISNNAYFAILSNLSHQTQYWYMSCVKIDGQTFYGEVKTFTTDVVPVTGVSLDMDACTVHSIDSTLILTPTVFPEDATNKSVSWESSNPSVATVDANGKVIAKDNGSTTITVTTSDQSKTATCEITVAQWVTGIKLDKYSVTLNEGQTTILTPTIFPSNANDKSVTLSSDNTSVAMIDQSGKVTAVSKGTAIIEVAANDGSDKCAFCSVTVIRPVSSITLSKTAITIYNGQTQTLTATVEPLTASNTSVTWSSSNTSVAMVSTSGVVTGISKGAAKIIASANDGSGKSASCSVTVYSLTNLSAKSSSNCYIVPSVGAYSFRTTQGNSSTSVGSVSSVTVLWESCGTSTEPSVGSIINNVSYSSNAIIFFTPSTLKNGNAVIAATNAKGTILWSWHIWVCKDFDPEATAQVYKNNAGTMMDRNLGATSATPGNVGALGLLYQWGRKDPFLGGGSISSNIKAASTLGEWPSPVSSDSNNGTIEYAISHPTTLITGNSNNYDWYFSNSTTSTEDARWKSSKTIYDPCPPGWKVPRGGDDGVWSKAGKSSSSYSHTFDSVNNGINFSGKFGSDSVIWYPATGSLSLSNGNLTGVGKSGSWWAYGSYDFDDRHFYYAYGFSFSDVTVNPTSYTYRAVGRSVRCQKGN